MEGNNVATSNTPVDEDNTTEPKRGHNGGGRTPVSSKTRARVRKLAREGMSRNAIAREVGISTGSVTTICKTARPPITFDRKAVKAATEARVADLKALRAVEAGKMLDVAVELRERLFAPIVTVERDEFGEVTKRTETQPTASDWRSTITAYGIAIDKHLVLVRHDSDDTDLPAVDKFIAAMLGGN